MKNIVFTLALTIGSLSLFSCRKEKASWDSDYKLILVNDTLRLENLSKDSLFAHDVSTGNYRLSFEKELLNFNIFEVVEIPDTSIVQKYGISLNSYTVQPGFSFVNNVKDHDFDLKDAKLTYAGVASGKITLEVENPYSTEVTFNVSLPKVKKNGQMLQRTFKVAKGTETNPTKASVSVDVADYEIDLTGTSGTGYNKLQSVMKLTSDPNGPVITIDKYDTTVFRASFLNLKVNRAKGYFGNKSLNESFSRNITFFNKLSGIVAIEDYNLDLILENSCKLEGQIKITNFKNENLNSGTVVALQHDLIGNPVFIQSATGDWQNHQSFVRTFNFNPSNSNLGAFISNLGSKITGQLEFLLNPNGNTSPGWNELFVDSRVKLKMKADMPIRIGASDLAFKDTFDVNLKNNVEKTHLKKGKFILEVANAYPVDLLASISMLDENGTVIGQVSATERVKASTEGTAFSGGVKYAKSKVEFELNESLFLKLSSVKKLIVNFKVNTFSETSASAPVITEIPYNGFIATKLYGDFGVNYKF